MTLADFTAWVLCLAPVVLVVFIMARAMNLSSWLRVADRSHEERAE